jgi:hypothetical protein
MKRAYEIAHSALYDPQSKGGSDVAKKIRELTGDDLELRIDALTLFWRAFFEMCIEQFIADERTQRR